MKPTQPIFDMLRAEIVQVTGCTEPASVAYAFLVAQRHLKRPFDPYSMRATLCASPEVLRNASTAMVPYLNRRGLRIVVAAGLASHARGFNLFPKVDLRRARALLARRGWLAVSPVRRHGLHVHATLEYDHGHDRVEVVISGRHDQIVRVVCNGRVIACPPPPLPAAPLAWADILRTARGRDPALERMARDFLTRQVRGRASLALPQRVAELVRARMGGSSAPVMTITGSGNQGIFIGVPFYDLYREQGPAVLPAVVLSLLAQVHLSQQKSRISGDCGLATKAAPALAAGLAMTQGASGRQIRQAMRAAEARLRGMTCPGARASCGRKAERAMKVVLASSSLKPDAGARSRHAKQP